MIAVKECHYFCESCYRIIKIVRQLNAFARGYGCTREDQKDGLGMLTSLFWIF